MRWRVLVATGLACVCAVLPHSVVHADVAVVSETVDRFTSELPGTPTGRSLSIAVTDPSHPGAKPPAMKDQVAQLPSGAYWDTHAIPACDDSNDTLLTAELFAIGPTGCPPGSQVGIDHVTLDTGIPDGGTGFPRFLHSDVLFFNARNGGRDEILFLVTDPTTHATTFVFTGTITNRDTLTVPVPDIPGDGPDHRASDVSENAMMFQRSSVQSGVVHGYLNTPPTCPPSHEWVDSMTYDFADGQSVIVRRPHRCMDAAPSAQRNATPSVGGPADPAAAPTPELPNTGRDGGKPALPGIAGLAALLTMRGVTRRRSGRRTSSSLPCVE